MAWSAMSWKVDALRCAARSGVASTSITKGVEEVRAWEDVLVDEAERQSFADEAREATLLVQSSAASATWIGSALRDATKAATTPLIRKVVRPDRVEHARTRAVSRV